MKDSPRKAAAQKSRLTTQKQAPASSSDPFELLFEQHPDPMWVYDLKDFSILEVNQAALQQYGYTRKEFLKLGLEKLRPEEDRPKFRQYVQRIDSNPTAKVSQHGVWRHIKKNGEIMYVEVSSNLLSFRGKQARLAVVHDVTEKIRASEQLQESE